MNRKRLSSCVVILSIAAVGCSKREEEPGRTTRSADVREVPRTGAQGRAERLEPPSIDPSAAPGVAFAYDYKFELADAAISAVQEAHAARCEQLGIERCRITGLRYTVGQDDAVSASLDVRLVPDLARQFGKAASDAVTKAGGRLRETEFTGEDTAPATSSATAQDSGSQAAIVETQRQLARSDLGDTERAQLRAQLSNLQQQQGDAKSILTNERAKLASTPMTFEYYGRGGVAGFNGRNPLAEASRSFIASMVTMISAVLQFLAYVLPWALLALLVMLLVRSRPGRVALRWIRPRRNREDRDDFAD